MTNTLIDEKKARGTKGQKGALILFGKDSMKTISISVLLPKIIRWVTRLQKSNTRF